MATGDVSLTINSDGWSGTLTVEGFTTGANYNFGLGANNTLTGSERLVLNITSLGYTSTVLGTRSRVSYGKNTVRKAHPNNASVDESVSLGNLVTRVAFSEPIFAKDKSGVGNSGTDITCTVLAGLVTNSGGGGQQSNARSNFTVTNNSTLAYPKCNLKWAQPGSERWTGDKYVEVVGCHPFGQNQSPFACVAFDGSDGTNSSTQQIATSMTASTAFTGDANTVWTYGATIPVSAFNQDATLTIRARGYPWIGDASSVIDTDTSADGVAAPSPNLTPLIGFCDKGNLRTIYACFDGVGAGTPQASTSQATAEANPYSTLALALAAAKTLNNSTNGVNTTDNCVILAKAGTYTAAGTFAGNNTQSWTIVKPATGVARSSVTFGTATNAAFTGWLKYEGVTFSGTGSGMCRGSTTVGQLWIDNCSWGNASTSQWYAWKLAHMTRTVWTAGTQNLVGSGSGLVAWGLIRGNDLSGISSKVAQSHCLIGNKGVTVRLVSTSQASTDGPMCNGSIIAWNSGYSIASATNCVSDNIVDNLSRISFMCNVWERIGGVTAPFWQVMADNNANLAADNIVFAHNTVVGARTNVNYLEQGNYAPSRPNWYDLYNCWEEVNTKTDTFQNAVRTVTDGVITNGSPNVSSATASFVAGDVGQNISFEQLPNGITTIASQTGTACVMNANATADATGVTLYIRNYGKDSRRVSNWAWLNGCGVRGTKSRQSNFNRDNTGINSQIGTVAFVRDASIAGTNAGNGDYHPDTGSILLNTVPAGGAVLPGDLDGRPIPNNGTGSSGALQLLSSGGGGDGGTSYETEGDDP